MGLKKSCNSSKKLQQKRREREKKMENHDRVRYKNDAYLFSIWKRDYVECGKHYGVKRFCFCTWSKFDDREWFESNAHYIRVEWLHFELLPNCVPLNLGIFAMPALERCAWDTQCVRVANENGHTYAL